MNILVDGRTFVKTSAGISTFLQGSLKAWASQRPMDTFILALPQKCDSSLDELVLPDNVIWAVSKKRIFKWLPNLVWLSVMMPILCLKHNVNIYFTPVPCIPFFLRKNVKKIIVVHDVVNIEFKETMEWTNKIATWFFFNRSIKNADIVWANSNYTKSSVEKYFSKRKCMDIFVGCAIDREIYNRFVVRPEEALSVRRKYGIEDKFMLFVGSLEPRKNLSFLLSIMPELWKRENVKLVIVGAKGWKETGINAIINNDNFPKESVAFCGYVSNQELAILYNMAECFISTSRNEGFGMPQLESFLCGCPVITADNSAMSEVAGGKQGSILVKGFDKNEWIESVCVFLHQHSSVDINEFMAYDWRIILKRFTERITTLS